MRQLAEITLPVSPDIVAQALEWLDAVGVQQQWPARSLFKLKLSLDETLTNIAMYGFVAQQPPAAPQVQLRLMQDTGRLALEIADNGVAFDPTAQTPRDLDDTLEDAQIGGHGLRLLQHYFEDIRYERRDGWNRLTLIAAHDDAS